MTFGIQKLVEPEAVSWVKKLMIYGSLDGPGQMYRWRIFLLLMNPWFLMLPGLIVQQTGAYCTWYRDASALYFPHRDMLNSLLYSLVSWLLPGNQPTCYADSKSLVEFKSLASSLWATTPVCFFFFFFFCALNVMWLFLLPYSQLWTKCPLKKSVHWVDEKFPCCGPITALVCIVLSSS